jgi:hypothetical protein
MRKAIVALRQVAQALSKFFKDKVMTGAYSVVHGFRATNAISGHEREFKPGEIVVSYPGQTNETVTIEIDNSFFVVGRSIFEASCKWNNVGAPL